jgi:hypothetical protein
LQLGCFEQQRLDFDSPRQNVHQVRLFALFVPQVEPPEITELLNTKAIKVNRIAIKCYYKYIKVKSIKHPSLNFKKPPFSPSHSTSSRARNSWASWFSSSSGKVRIHMRCKCIKTHISLSRNKKTFRLKGTYDASLLSLLILPK